MTTTATRTQIIKDLATLIDQDRAVTSDDLHDWAHDIDWNNYTVDDLADNEISAQLAEASAVTGESAADLVQSVEYLLGW